MDFAKVDSLINKAIASQNQRSAKIITNRYGLESKDIKTLAELGVSYSLTRERIRQIQAHVMKTIKEEMARHKDVTAFLKFVNGHLDKMGNVRASHLLAKDLKGIMNPNYDEAVFLNRLHFLAELIGEPKVAYGDDNWHDTWHNNPESHKKARAVVSHLLDFKEHNFSKFVEDAVKKFGLSEKTIINYLGISKEFGTGPYGDLGARHWIHVNPKTTRNKNFLVLKKVGKPMHFREIADLINKLEGVKRSHPDTVHNELIKDPRFVLVGRGVYALRENE
ncbi:MAG: hypothetical protein A3B23_00600 [Candidatus Colwellbacteria bacterium RIFCSPLOWO2_01_FULL_48_10]|uniref:HTH HARE-type domain-containing protein n=1 Tax=Candidatus Colwellbacteria bacterium RIFCSPLOWO2_01_FULL_48_10 TaxID=1797690 RepID=A0A1G1Z6Y8_9BACT|nr:MAG: hypothetical protein A3B23_00600 [Candidatus Colwellbacteria bacterium RIFCSPLOWO2_01_FULL_48_10]